MAISDTLSSIITNLSNAYSVIGSMGGSIPLSKNMENLPSAIGTIPTGGTDNLIAYAMGSIAELNYSEITKLEQGAFAMYDPLAVVSLPNCSEIGALCFSYCHNLSEVNLPSCTSIGYDAFCYCDSLQIIELPNVEWIGSRAFSDCTALTYVSIPNCISTNDHVFYNCGNLQEVYCPNMTAIESYTFYSCNSLASINPLTVSYVGVNAFRYCQHLPSITLSVPEGGTLSISQSAFANCGALTTLTIYGSTVATLSGGALGAPLTQSGTIYVPASLVTSYKTATTWRNYSNRIQSIPE